MGNRLQTILSLFFIIGAGCLHTGCDTENSVEPRFEKVFIKYYGDQGDQSGKDLKQTIDLGFVLLGITNPDNDQAQESGDEDIFIVKVDSIGNEQFRNTIGGNNTDVPGNIIESSNGEFIISVNTKNALDNWDIVVYRLDASMQVLDSAVFGNTNTNETLGSITEVSNGYIVAGTTTNVDVNKNGYDATTDLTDLFSVRMDFSLVVNPVWTNVFGFPGIDEGVAVYESNNGKFLFIGSTDIPNPNDSQKDGINFFSFSAGPTGIPDDEAQRFGTLNDETASSVGVTEVNSFIILGTSQSGALNDMFLVRLRSDLSFESQGTVGSTLNPVGVSVTESLDGGAILLGRSDLNDQTDIYLAKVTIQRQIIWETTFGENFNDDGGAVIELNDGSIVLVGTVELDTQKKMALIKTSPNGDLRP